jgi:hypothetical protein
MRIESSDLRLRHFIPPSAELPRFPTNLGVCIHEIWFTLQIQGRYESGDNGAGEFFNNTGASVTGDVDQHLSEILLLRELERKIQVAGWTHGRSS